jgi:uncharacterized protein YigE (DUF2233 family)
MKRFRFGRRAAVALALLPLAAEASQGECRSESFEGASYIVCSFDMARDDVRLFWRYGEGEPYRTFHVLATDLEAEGKTLKFAMNGGMYGEGFAPIGLYVEDGRELVPANTTTIEGMGSAVPNFYKKPNGVFYISGGEAGVMETAAFLATRPDAAFATQSGPMLVVDGAIHPAFIEDSSDRKPRNGVCASSPTEVHFALADEWVNFHAFARFFRDGLGCENALFLDGGSAPGIYAPELQRNDAPGHGGYGPIIGVVE